MCTRIRGIRTTSRLKAGSNEYIKAGSVLEDDQSTCITHVAGIMDNLCIFRPRSPRLTNLANLGMI